MQSNTYLADLSERVIEAGWLATLVLAPLFFNPYSSRVFEPDKVALVRSLALVMVAAWLLWWIERSATHGFRFGPAALRLPPLGLPVAAVVFAWLLSTAFSLQPMVSLVGSYPRLQGAYTTLCGAALFCLLVGFLRERAQLERVLDAIVLASLPLSLYALVQYAGNDPLAWQQGFGARVFSTQGNPLFLSALLAMMFFPTLSRAFACLDQADGRSSGWSGRLPALGYFLLAAIQLLALLFADSRGPVFAWLLALGLFILVYITAVALSFPGASVLTILAGLLFGWLAGGVAVVISATIGAVILFKIVNTSFGDVLVKKAGPMLSRINAGFAADAFNYLLFLRLVPAFPFWLVNIASALANVKLRTFALATLIGIIPGTFAFAFLGEGLDSLITAQSASHDACVVAKGAAACPFELSASSLITKELLIAFAVLGVVALIPVALKKWKNAHAV